MSAACYERRALLPTGGSAFSLRLTRPSQFDLGEIEARDTGVTGALAMANKNNFHILLRVCKVHAERFLQACLSKRLERASVIQNNS